MMKFTIILVMAFVFVSSITVQLEAQEVLNKAYFDSLAIILKKDTNITKLKFIQEKYRNGQIKTQRLFIKLKGDKSKRYWIIGKEYLYHKCVFNRLSVRV